ncbi:hypothetical protein JCM10213_000498 [Rhodosporidiobolus nylandii]
MSRNPPTFDQYYASSPSPFSRRSSTFSPLLGGTSSRRISIRTPSLTHAPSGLPGFLRGRGRWRKAAVGVALALVVGLLVLVRSVKSGRFAQVGGFGLDYMGREEAADGGKRLPPVEIAGGTSKLCLLFPWRNECIEEAKRRRDPFEGLRFREDRGRIIYPATIAPPPPPKPGRRPSTVQQEPPDPALQPHPIHHLIRQAKKEWKAKVEGQSKDLRAAITEYERRYKRRPPKGFADWYFYAKANDFVMVDEFDLMMRQVEPFLAVKPSTMVQRHDRLQGFEPEDEKHWLYDKCFTVQLKQHGGVLDAHGPMKNANERTDQMLKLLGGIAKYLPDMNVTFTGHDVPWVVLSGENRALHVERARAGQVLSDAEAEDYKDPWEYDGWAQICPPDSPLRRVPPFDDRMTKGHIYTEPRHKSFIKDHTAAMDLCTHPESQLIHGFTAWPGPRPGLLYPVFVSTTTSMHSDLLIPPIDQYDRRKGDDPAWEDKKENKAFWLGTTTGADLNIEHMRKWSQRPRLCRLPFQAGSITLPYAPSDSNTTGIPGPMGSLTARSQALAQRYFDFKFLGEAKQCHDPKVCAEFEKEFLWRDWAEPEEQNQYKYLVDVDGNGWSGRFHRLMSTNSLVLKQTLFPEWYSDMIQPWVHYVPISTDYSDLWTAMAFFLGDENGVGAHDEIAKEIAAEGKRWTEMHWRWVDMEIYMYRLLLEYSRIIGRSDDNLHSMDM